MLQFYALFDKKTGGYRTPFSVKHVAEATRAVQVHLEEGKGDICRYPGDFALYFLSEFNQETGQFTKPDFRPTFTIEVVSLLGPPNGVEQADLLRQTGGPRE